MPVWNGIWDPHLRVLLHTYSDDGEDTPITTIAIETNKWRAENSDEIFTALATNGLDSLELEIYPRLLNRLIDVIQSSHEASIELRAQVAQNEWIDHFVPILRKIVLEIRRLRVVPGNPLLRKEE